MGNELELPMRASRDHDRIFPKVHGSGLRDLRLTGAAFGVSISTYRGQTGRRVTPARIERDLERLPAMDRSHS